MPVKKKRGPAKGRKKPTPTIEKLNIESLLIREARKLSFLGLLSFIPILLFVKTIPEQKRLSDLEERLVDAKKEEQVALEANDRIAREISAYRSNPEYLEIIARDHLNYYKQGETIIRIER